MLPASRCSKSVQLGRYTHDYATRQHSIVVMAAVPLNWRRHFSGGSGSGPGPDPGFGFGFGFGSSSGSGFGSGSACLVVRGRAGLSGAPK